jgi:hypothetical protein
LSDLPFDTGRHKWLRLSLAATALYLLLLVPWWYSLDLLAVISAILANPLYGFFDPPVSINWSGKTISVFATAAPETGFGGQVHSSSLRVDTITYGLPMLVALVAVTSAGSLKAKLQALLIGMVVMLALTVPAVMMWAKMTSLQLDDRIAQESIASSGNRSNFFYYAFHGYAFSQPVVAVGIWLSLLTLGFFKEKPQEPQRASTEIHRNAPCPCGSGRKYKRCCARSA